LGIPLVVSDQGGLTTHPFLNESGLFLKILYKIQKIVIKKIINHASAISAANEYERDIFLEFKKNSKIEIIRNGINLKTLVSKENFRNKYKISNKFILFVGRFSISKGIKTLIQAFNLVQNENKFSDISLIIMGVDFGYEKDMEKLIHTLNLSKKIIIIKNPPREDVISAYGESEFLVLPSQWELSPLVPLESFAFKKPVISTKSHGIPFTVKDNENGILVEPEKPEQLSEAITKLLFDDELKEKLGLSGYNFVHEKCNSVSMAKHSLKLYNELLKNNDNK
jgi:glycosyltransferase involved in cell wall biosynthesis